MIAMEQDDVTDADLQKMFNMVDEDNSGVVDHDEFSSLARNILVVQINTVRPLSCSSLSLFHARTVCVQQSSLSSLSSEMSQSSSMEASDFCSFLGLSNLTGDLGACWYCGGNGSLLSS